MDLLDKLSGEFEITHLRKGKIINQFKAKNLITNEGRRHLLRLAFDVIAQQNITSVQIQRSQYTSSLYYPAVLYMGLIGADITPSVNDVLSLALGPNGVYSEITTYTANQTDGNNTFRPTLFMMVQNNQSTFVSNANYSITFTFTNTTPTTVYGFFTTTIRVKGANSQSTNTTFGQYHCLFSASRFTSPVEVVEGDQLVVVYKISL